MLRHRRHDFALYAVAGRPSVKLIGADFSHAMLVRARQKSGNRKIRWVEADALNLPFEPWTISPGHLGLWFRNLANYNRGP